MSDTGLIRIALAQINPTVGDLSKNADLISKYAFDAANAGAVVVVYPEMILTGYPVEDLANRASFRAASIAAVEKLAVRINSEGNGDLTLLVGYLGQSEGGRPQNCVAVIYRGEIMATYIKHHLPNYGVFDEYRNFAPGNHSLVIRVCGVDIGIAICEDIWQAGGPVAELAKRNIGLLLVPNVSPFELNKDDARMGEIYLGAYIKDSETFSNPIVEGVYKPHELPQIIESGWTLIGNAIETYEKEMKDHFGQQIDDLIDGPYEVVESISKLAKSFIKNKAFELINAEPVYLRNKVAFTTEERKAFNAIQ